jgi:hypothetical protein
MRKNAQGHEVIMLSLYAMVRAIVVEKWKSSAWPRKVKIRLDGVFRDGEPRPCWSSMLPYRESGIV